MEAGQKRRREDEGLEFGNSSLAAPQAPEVSPWEQRFAAVLDLQAGGCLQKSSDPSAVVAVLMAAPVG